MKRGGILNAQLNAAISGLGHGDLVVMGGRCQTEWRHSVPKQTTPAGPRISVNFRASSQARPS